MDDETIPKPVVLAILDGWGVAPESEGNAITNAKTPNFDKLVDSYPAMTLSASGEAVGLAEKQPGNSEAGHLTIGTGQVFYKDLVRIDKAIKRGGFYKNRVLLKSLEHVLKNKSKLHFIGMLSDAGKESHERHLYALLDFIRKNKFKEKVFLHLILDGREAAFNSGLDFVKKLSEEIKRDKNISIASISGRFYALDRGRHWERTEKVYRSLVEGESEKKFNSASEAIGYFYQEKKYDEEIPPTVISDKKREEGRIGNNDAVVLFNFGISHTEQLVNAFVDKNFDKFPVEKLKNLYFVSFWGKEKGLHLHLPFAKGKVKSSLGKIISEANLKQLRLGETEKYTHITYYFDGFREEPYKDEDWQLIPSPNLPSYEEVPEMSAKAVKERVIKAINGGGYDFIAFNFANPDMLGHIGDIGACSKAIEAVDKYLGDVKDAVLAKDGVLLIVGSHGNAEEILLVRSGQPQKDHTINPVPFIAVYHDYEGRSGGVEVPGGDLSLVRPVGSLVDVAPTILKIMKLPQPREMKGRPLI